MTMDSQSKVIKVEPRADARELIYSSSNVSNSHVTYQQQTSMKREVTRSHLTIENVCPSSSSISSYQDTSRRDDKELQRPPHSYAALIAMAIRASPSQELYLTDIYSYVQKNFPFYRKEDKGWKNSIRHNLSLNKSFLRKPPPNRTEGRKSSLWFIDPQSEDMYENGDYRRRKKSKNSNFTKRSTSSYRRNRVEDVIKMMPDVGSSLVSYDVANRINNVHGFANHQLENESLNPWHQSHHQVVPRYPESVGTGYAPLMLTVGSSCTSYQEQTSPPQPHPLANYQFVYPCPEPYPPSNGQTAQYVRSE